MTLPGTRVRGDEENRRPHVENGDDVAVRVAESSMAFDVMVCLENARRISKWLRRSLMVVGVGLVGLATAGGCSESDAKSDCDSPQVHSACSRPDLLCGVGSCDIAQCNEGHWCTAITPTPACNAPTPPPGFCPPSPPDVGTSCAATNGTTCQYPCAGGAIYSACNDGVFCNVYTCES